MTRADQIILTPDRLAMFEMLQAPIWIFDIEHWTMWWANRAALHIWHAETLEELLSRDFSTISEADKTRLQSYLHQFQRGETVTEPWIFEPAEQVVVSCLCSGIQIEVSRTAMLVEGRLATVQPGDRDLSRSIEVLRHATLMVSLYSLEGDLLMQNPAAAQCYGEVVEYRAIPGNNTFLQRFVDPEIGKQAIAIVKAEEALSIEAQMLTLQGVSWHRLDVRGMSDPITGQFIMLINERNVGDRRRAETALQLLNEELESHVEARTAELRRANAQLQAEIIKRKRVEEVLRESEARFYKLVANVPGMIYQYIQHIDSRGEFSYISPSCQDIYEIAPNEAQQDPQKLFLTIHPDDVEAVQTSLDAITRSLEPWRSLYRIITPSGQLKWIQAISRPEPQPNGDIVWDGVLMDVSDRKQAEEALRESEEMFRRIFEYAPIGIALTDKNSQIVKVNQAFCQILGYTEAELLTLTMHAITHPEDATSNLQCCEQVLDGNLSYYRLEKRYLKKNGDLLWANLTATFLHDATGNSLYSLGMVEDITERKRAEVELKETLNRERELNELKSNFISTVSHEFRTPLSIITTSVELLQHYSKSWTEEKRQLRFERIYSAIDWMTKLLNDVLMIGKIEAGKLRYNPVLIDVCKFCHDLVEELQRNLNAEQTLTFVQQGKCDLVTLDEALLNHILTNLIENAIKYSPAAGSIRLELDCGEYEICFRVEDTGIGIPAADQAQLFMAFQRGSNVGTISGTGLGLAIVKQCVDLHRGKIRVVSQEGQGTLFTITLPISE